MNTRLLRRIIATARTILAVLAFTALAAVGLATAQVLRPTAQVAAACGIPDRPSTGAIRSDLHAAPNACPIPARAFVPR